MTESAASTSGHAATNAPFVVAVREGDLLILDGEGRVVSMTIDAARRSAHRLLDAIEVAAGRVPASRPADQVRPEPRLLRA